MSHNNLRQCKNFIECQNCRHVDGCVTVTNCVGYCLNNITCIEHFKENMYCYDCNKYISKDSIYSSACGNPLYKAPHNPDAEERKRMIEFFFPKQNKPINPDDPWEFL